jgi:hypothetical protein
VLVAPARRAGVTFWRLGDAEPSPTEAGDISYRQWGYGGHLEFTISETGFREWLKSDRLHAFRGIRSSRNSRPVEPHESLVAFTKSEGQPTSIRSPLMVERRGDDGGGYTILFDRANRRAYYDWSTH